MSAEKAKNYLKKYNMDNRIITFKTSSATVKDAANSIGCEEAKIAKTLSFNTTNGVILIVTAGDVKIDNSKYRQEFKEKAHMLPFEDVEIKVGHPVGGVCPFGVNEGINIYLDESLKRFDTIYPACGTDHNAIEISIKELEEVTGYVKWVDVCKTKELSSN